VGCEEKLAGQLLQQGGYKGMEGGKKKKIYKKKLIFIIREWENLQGPGDSRKEKKKKKTLNMRTAVFRKGGIT